MIQTKYISSDAGSTTKPLDLAKAIQYFTLDSLTRVAFGRAFGFLATESDVYGYIDTVRKLFPVLTLMTEMPLLRAIAYHPWIMDLTGPKATDQVGLGKLLGLAKAMVAERFGPDARNKQDMLGAFVRHGISQRQCEIEIPPQIAAGSDTTATAIRGTMLYIITTRRVYDRLQKEIDAAIAAGKISDPVTADQGKGLEYLQAVIYEGLRMQIPFSGLLMKEAPPGGDTYNGQYIPGGTRIGHNTIAIMRNKRIFGDDAEVFRPERWLMVADGG